ncbi:hypothetical protein C8R44DRAFT_613539 [Mycena epipterygia]|nr:hypothetical protein C8R44DRAFT_613539 [Mycena epipterygia]
MALNKITIERNQRTLLDLVAQPGNDVCADCKVKNPRWASHSLGIFICVSCASVHRKIGTHVTKVKSLTMDSWTREQTEVGAPCLIGWSPVHTCTEEYATKRKH